MQSALQCTTVLLGRLFACSGNNWVTIRLHLEGEGSIGPLLSNLLSNLRHSITTNHTVFWKSRPQKLKHSITANLAVISTLWTNLALSWNPICLKILFLTFFSLLRGWSWRDGRKTDVYSGGSPSSLGQVMVYTKQSHHFAPIFFSCTFFVQYTKQTAHVIYSNNMF